MPGHVVGHLHQVASPFIAPVVVHNVEKGVESLQPVLFLLGKLDPFAFVHGQGILHNRRVHRVDVVEQNPESALCEVVVQKLPVIGLSIRLRDVALAFSNVVLGKVIHAAVGHDAQGRSKRGRHICSIKTCQSMRYILARVKAEMFVEGVAVVLSVCR